MPLSPASHHQVGIVEVHVLEIQADQVQVEGCPYSILSGKRDKETTVIGTTPTKDTVVTL